MRHRCFLVLVGDTNVADARFLTGGGEISMEEEVEEALLLLVMVVVVFMTDGTSITPELPVDADDCGGSEVHLWHLL